MQQQISLELTTDLPPTPNPALRSLDKLVGTWDLVGRELGTGGEIRGRLTFEWLEGGFFLVQHVDIDHVGTRIMGIEVIGCGREWGSGAVDEECTSHFYDNSGSVYTYVYEVGDDAMTIWAGQAGSPASFRGRFSEDRKTITGEWRWPGGGYEATMTRVE